LRNLNGVFTRRQRTAGEYGQIRAVLPFELSFAAPIKRTRIDNHCEEAIVGVARDGDLHGDVRRFQGCGRRDTDVGDPAIGCCRWRDQEQYRTDGR